MISTTYDGIALATLQELSLARGWEQFVREVERLAREAAGASRARLLRLGGDWLVDSAGLRVAVAEDSVAGRCALLAEAVAEEEDSPDPVARAAGVRTHTLALPLLRYGSLVGVLEVGTLAPLAAERVGVLKTLCAVAGIIERWAEQREDFERFTGRTQDLLIRAVEQLTPEGPGHVLRVARLASELAVRLDLSAQSRQLLWQAALYHDVGKIALAGDDPAEIRRFHPRAGADFLSGTESLRAAAPLVDASHERWDGSGTPRGLSGDAVPLEGWVLALAEDAEEFRFSRPGMTYEDWVPAFWEQRASKHHPDVVDALGSLVDDDSMRRLWS